MHTHLCHFTAPSALVPKDCEGIQSPKSIKQEIPNEESEAPDQVCALLRSIIMGLSPGVLFLGHLQIT